ncbi:6-phosphogluconolactonase [Microbacterium sp. JB110]|uniref:6-phosphogluconolactonase n=1 Tax=Microbacterium sp. JB110 TaxID=2024477 RepID=UPI000B34AD1F|nr:6-phosphogluconolactonase [Microbacterium sp. JB110]RCS60217.1 glucosamine-6-phosphate deaminase [Microbacterium sp. JB110]
MTDVDNHDPQAEWIVVETAERETARRAAACAAATIERAIAEKGHARVVFASAPSQEAMLAELTTDPRIDWSRITAFHMDEYLDLRMDHPQAFGSWLEQRLPRDAHVGLARIRTDAVVVDEITRYTALLAEAPIDLVCLGVGVNGHIAFNEPGQADIDDDVTMREIRLDDASRTQQVDDGLFPTFDDVPARALTLTVPALMSATTLVCTVLGSHKAAAVAAALEGPVARSCPASYLQRHHHAHWFVDTSAARLLTGSSVRSQL